MKGYRWDENINLDNIDCFNGTVIVRAPSRLHLSVKNMMNFDVGKSGGGGVGVGINVYTEVRAAIIYDTKEDDIVYKRKNVINRFISILKKLYCFNGFFKVEVFQEYDSHMGMGSTESACVTVMFAINKLLGNKMSYNDIINLYLNNAIEEDLQKNSNVVNCFETGVGPWTNTLAGMVIIDKNGQIQSRCEISPSYSLLLIMPKDVVNKNSNQDEADLLWGKGREYDKQFINEKSAIFNDMLNDMNSYNKEELLFKNIGVLSSIGSKKAEIEYQDNLYNGYHTRVMKIAKEKGILCCTMSSVGPCIVLIDKEKKIKEFKDQISKIIEYNSILEVKVDNNGVDLREYYNCGFYQDFNIKKNIHQ